MDFFNAYAQGFARVAVRVLPVKLAQPESNAAAVVADLEGLTSQPLALVSYPELNLTGASCGDLFKQEELVRASESAIGRIVEASQRLAPMVVVGAPVAYRSRVYDCAVVVQAGAVLGVVPRCHQGPADQRARWFAPGDDVDGTLTVAGHAAPINPRLLFEVPQLPGFRLHVTVAEDMTGPVPAALLDACAQGATVVANLSGDPAAIGQPELRRAMARALTLRHNIAYLVASPGPGESSTNDTWDGDAFIAEAGHLLAESELFCVPSLAEPTRGAGCVADVDVRGLGRPTTAPPTETIVSGSFTVPSGDIGLLRAVDRFPFAPWPGAGATGTVPTGPDNCQRVYDLLTGALVQRMRAIGAPKLVLGVSGVLDSTNALIVCAKAMDALGRPRQDILAFTMPGFATSDKTKGSALALMESIGASAETLDIRPAAMQILGDLGHPYAQGEPVYDVTFENVQAGLRADYLFRIANQRGGIVVGTGDLSEAALGWCTYGVGDQISHYNVNAGLTKTLIQQLVRWVAGSGAFDEATSAVLTTIVDQEISPELVPSADGLQPTESLIGPYALHDFFLHHLLRGQRPSRIAYLAYHAWSAPADKGQPAVWPQVPQPSYNLSTIRAWLEFFLKRFFANQFKRSAAPDGPGLSRGGSLSPRGGWQMPSDAAAVAWLAELADNVPNEPIERM